MLGKKSTTFAGNLLRMLLGVIFLLLAIHLSLQYLNLSVFYEYHGAIYELSNRFDFDDEVSVPSWFAQFLFLAISGAAFLAAFVQKNKALKRLWMIPAVIALLFSIDESSALHEFFLQLLHVTFYQDAGATLFDNSWLMVLPFVVIAAGIYAWQAYKRLPLRTSLLIVFAGVVFLSGAVFVDLLANTIQLTAFTKQGILVAIEEALELIGSSVVLYAVVDYIERHHRQKITNAIKQLRP